MGNHCVNIEFWEQNPFLEYFSNFHSSVKMSDKDKDKEKEKEKTESKPGDLGLLEEDDEFEEFPAEDWTNREEDPSDVNVWEDNWDDDNVEDDFSVQLKSELESQGVAMEQS